MEVSKKRMEYNTGAGNNRTLLTEALDKLLAREGKDALKDFDGVFYVYAGDRYPSPRGSLYWPHRGTFTYQSKRWPYFICPEGGQKMANISVFAHEFGHMLGLPDLYARPEVPGMIYRQLGTTGERVSAIGLGGYHIGKSPEAEASIALIRQAIDRGITFMDNCWDYNDGVSEIRMGKALAGGYRNKVFLMTKIDGRTKVSAAQQIDESLKRLQTYHVNLMQFH